MSRSFLIPAVEEIAHNCPHSGLRGVPSHESSPLIPSWDQRNRDSPSQWGLSAGQETEALSSNELKSYSYRSLMSEWGLIAGPLGFFLSPPRESYAFLSQGMLERASLSKNKMINPLSRKPKIFLPEKTWSQVFEFCRMMDASANL